MLEQIFSIDKDEIVRGEYFSHTNEPMLTFNPARNLIYVNAGSLKRLPDMDYALLVISVSQKRLSILPCDMNERDAIRLRSGGQYRNRPRQIRCRVDFSDKMLSLMKWKRDCRYRMIGYMAVGKFDTLIAFDLSAAEEFSHGGFTAKVLSRSYDEFGPVFEMQLRNPLVKIAEQGIEISTENVEGKTVYEN